jgi:hypothetical protein
MTAVAIDLPAAQARALGSRPDIREVVGALSALWVTGTPRGSMAFLGIASLVGMIVSHIIVLFDFIEERHGGGRAFETGVARRGRHAPAARDDRRRSHCHRALPARRARRAAVGAALLHADRRAHHRDVRHAAPRARAVCDVRPRSEDRHLGTGVERRRRRIAHSQGNGAAGTKAWTQASRRRWRR